MVFIRIISKKHIYYFIYIYVMYRISNYTTRFLRCAGQLNQMVIGWFERHSGISWIATIIIGIAIFYISSLTFAQVPVVFRINWKTIFYHFAVFFFFSFFLHISLIKGKNITFILPSIIIGIIYGLSDEIHQLFVPGRFCSFSDWMLDTSGILLASLVYLIYINYKTSRQNLKF